MKLILTKKGHRILHHNTPLQCASCTEPLDIHKQTIYYAEGKTYCYACCNEFAQLIVGNYECLWKVDDVKHGDQPKNTQED